MTGPLPPSSARTDAGSDLLAAVILVLAVVAAYLNSLSGPFIFDDLPSIRENPTIRDLSRIGDVVNPPRTSGLTVNGRPVVNLSLAVNRATGGIEVTHYHVTNLLIHLAATLAAFGVLRQVLGRYRQRPAYDREVTWAACLGALLWALHPLQTQSVTYVIQRAEALVGLWYLLTIYCFFRSFSSPRSRLWLAGSVLGCLLGVGTKEVIVSAPIFVVLCDRMFFAGTFAAAWRLRKGFYLALFATWIPLAYSIHAAGGRGGTVGFGLGGVTPWMYLLTQAEALVRYVRLTVWPHALVFDYGMGVQTDWIKVWKEGIVVLAALGGTAYGLWRRSVWGLLGSWFFLILAPSSSVVPIVTETVAEHRMYLPLLAPAVLAGAGLIQALGRKAFLPCFLAGSGLIALTHQRNDEYRSEVSIWHTTVLRYPASARANNNLGEMLARKRQFDGALHYYRQAVRLDPGYRDALTNLGSLLHRVGQREEGMGILERLYRAYPRSTEVLTAFGGACFREGHVAEAKQLFLRALEINPASAEANNNLAVVLTDQGQPDLAIQHLERALLPWPDYPDALYNYANALMRLGRKEEAKAKLLATLGVDPTYAEAHNNLGAVLIALGDARQATVHFARAVELKPSFPDSLNNLGVMRYQAGELTEARELFERALRAKPDYVDARNNLEMVQETLRAGAGSPKPR